MSKKGEGTTKVLPSKKKTFPLAAARGTLTPGKPDLFKFSRKEKKKGLRGEQSLILTAK